VLTNSYRSHARYAPVPRATEGLARAIAEESTKKGQELKALSDIVQELTKRVEALENEKNEAVHPLQMRQTLQLEPKERDEH